MDDNVLRQLAQEQYMFRLLVKILLERGHGSPVLNVRVNRAAVAFCCFAGGVRELAHDSASETKKEKASRFPAGLLLARLTNSY
jgi:hypothetical protein